MANIVQQTSQSNHVNRSTFDLSGNINLTAAPGMLLPIRVDDCLPNSRYDFNMAMFARTVQMVVPSFARVKAHVDTFFVPYRLLGTDIAATIVGDKRGMESCYKSDGTFDATGSTGLPYFDLSHIVKVTSNTASFNFPTGVDAAGVDVNVTSPILVNALGYGVPNYGNFPVAEDVSSNVPNNLGKISIASKSLVEGNYYAGKGKFSPLYLLAYNKIYQDYYRNKLWEKENKASYFVKSSEMNSDITTRLINSGSFEMRYHDYDKDRIIGMIPDENGILSDGLSQYASTILSASNGLDSTSSLGGSQNPITTPQTLQADTFKPSNYDLYDGTGFGHSIALGHEGTLYDSTNGDVRLQQYTALTNRRMEAFQKFAQICMLNKSDYKHQVKAHFGFTPSDLGSDYSQMIGSFDVPLSISDVENTTETNQGYLAGKGTMSGQSRRISFTTGSDYGCIMSILYIVPQIDWSNEFVDRANFHLNRYDFAIPEFDRLGYEPVRLLDIFGVSNIFSSSQRSPYSIVGYLPRYWQYKTRLDVNSTGFSSSDKDTVNFNSYVVRYDKSRIAKAIDDGSMFEALKARPNDLDTLFPVNWSSVQDNPFIITVYVSAKAQLPLSIDSLPY